MTEIITSDAINNEESRLTTCPYCGVGCGVDAKFLGNQVLGVSGQTDHPANLGRLCVKGSSLHETVSPHQRILKPMVNGEERDWDSALNQVAKIFQECIEKYGPDSVAFYLSGQLLTEDYYVANKLMKGFLGTANIDTNSRLCMASAVVAHKRAFGEDVVPGCYEDLEQTEVLFFVGSNAAYAHPIVFQRIVQAKKERGMKIVVLDPRRTATCDIADLHLPIRPGTDAFFYNGMLVYLAQHHHLDAEFLALHTQGIDEALALARSQTPSVAETAKVCDVDEASLLQAFQWFAEHKKVVTLFSQGINQSSSGVDKGNAIINCHLATGKIGKVGSTPFSITGQPNAMGGREVGGLANQLAAHLTFDTEDVELLKEFWQSPNVADREGLKAVDMFDAVYEGKIKAIWIMGTNPVVSMPNANKVREALERCEHVIVSDCTDTDTTAMANIILPASTWSEKTGSVTNSERCISLQRGFLPRMGEARSDWRIVCDVAGRLGFKEAFSFQHVSEVFKEHAALSGFKNKGQRAFNLSHLSSMTQQEYEAWTPKQWPITGEAPEGTTRLFSDGQFFTPNKKARFIPIKAELPKKAPNTAFKTIEAQTDDAFEKQYIMNTGRIRDQWHTMTRTGKAPRLLSHQAEPFVQIHPLDAQALKLKEGEILELENLGAVYLGRAQITSNQRRGEVFVPMHWNDQFSSSARADALVNAITDPLCGQPEFKHSPVNVKVFQAKQYGLLVSTQSVDLETRYWAKVPVEQGYAYPIADCSMNVGALGSEVDSLDWLKTHYTEVQDWVVLEDASRNQWRYTGFAADGRFLVGLWLAPQAHLVPEYHWVSTQLNSVWESSERFTLLAGCPGDESAAPGTIICSCFQVGENTIKAAISEGADSAEALGERLKCGTNCGSCIPELNGLIDQFLAL